MNRLNRLEEVCQNYYYACLSTKNNLLSKIFRFLLFRLEMFSIHLRSLLIVLVLNYLGYCQSILWICFMTKGTKLNRLQLIQLLLLLEEKNSCKIYTIKKVSTSLKNSNK